MADRLLEVEDIQVYYGAIHALKGITFHLDKGEIVALIGANGAGKSTTLNTISGLLRSRTGRIVFNSSDITQTQSELIVRRGVVQVPEGRKIFATLTVQENLEMGRLYPQRSIWHPKRSRWNFSSVFLVWRNDAANWAAPFQAASSKCWRSRVG